MLQANGVKKVKTTKASAAIPGHKAVCPIVYL